jgi:hypothetical protein
VSSAIIEGTRRTPGRRTVGITEITWSTDERRTLQGGSRLEWETRWRSARSRLPRMPEPIETSKERQAADTQLGCVLSSTCAYDAEADAAYI